MSERKLNSDELPELCTPAHAATLLGVAAATVRSAMRRWDLGVQVATGEVKGVSWTVLRRKDIKYLAKHLQHGAGNPNWKKRKAN